MLQKIKELAAEAEDDEDRVSDLTTQEDSDSSNNSRGYITTNSTLISVLKYQTGYTSLMIVHSLEKITQVNPW